MTMKMSDARYLEGWKHGADAALSWLRSEFPDLDDPDVDYDQPSIIQSATEHIAGIANFLETALDPC